MSCGGSVSKILVGLHQVGLVGLPEVLQTVAAAGLTDENEIRATLMERLTARNYIPPGREDSYRWAVWREYLRHLGRDIRSLYTEVPVVVRGLPGEERDQFVAVLESVFGEFELRPVVEFVASEPGSPTPELLLHGEVIARAGHTRRRIKGAVSRQISHW